MFPQREVRVQPDAQPAGGSLIEVEQSPAHLYSSLLCNHYRSLAQQCGFCAKGEGEDGGDACAGVEGGEERGGGEEEPCVVVYHHFSRGPPM